MTDTFRARADLLGTRRGSLGFHSKPALEESPEALRQVAQAVARAKQGDREAVRFLYLQYADNVYGYVRSIVRDGVPDLRIVIFRGVPVMAMTRLPTHRSRGRANLHQGAIGAGVDLATGRTTHAVAGTVRVRHHPDTGELVVDRDFPGFATGLEIAVRATDETGLGYVGADVVVDARRGPVILELNARPGLAIQIANQRGLLPRLRAVEAAGPEGLSLSDRIALGREVAGRTQGEIDARH